MQIKTTTYLDVVAFQCNDGYHFDTTKGGSEIVVCRADGTWSNKPPTCKCECLFNVIDQSLIELLFFLKILLIVARFLLQRMVM